MKNIFLVFTLLFTASLIMCDGGGTSDDVAVITPPAQVTNVQVVEKTGSTITLDWDSVSGVSQYNVYQSATELGPYTLSDLYMNTRRVTKLTSKTKYYFTVSAVRGVEGARSTPISGTTANLMSAPTIASIDAVSGNLRITWNSVTGASGYILYKATSEFGTYYYCAGNPITAYTSTTYDDTNVNFGNTYWYKVAAVDSSGYESQSSSALSGEL